MRAQTASLIIDGSTSLASVSREHAEDLSPMSASTLSGCERAVLRFAAATRRPRPAPLRLGLFSLSSSSCAVLELLASLALSLALFNR
jgi:hypothetical protein